MWKRIAAFVGVAVAALLVLWFVAGSAPSATVRPLETVDSSLVAENPGPAPVVDTAETEIVRTEVKQLEESGAEAEAVLATESAEGDLRVVVVDEAAQPLGGVPVGIFLKDERSRSKLFAAKTASESGLGVLKGAAASVAKFAKSRPGSRYQVGLDVPGVDLEFVDIDLLSWPEEVIRLTAPAHGTLEVEIVDEEGAPVVGHNWLHVFPLFEKPSSPGYLHRGERFSAFVKGVSKVTIPYVPAGTQLRVSVNELDLVGKGEVEVEALRPGELKTATLTVQGSLPYVTGRVVLPNGEAVDAQYLKTKGRGVGTSRVTIDPDGSFVLPLSRLRPNSGDRVTVQLRIQLSGPNGVPAAGPTLSGEFDAKAPAPGDPTEVGDIVMREAPVFASGTVVDGAGNPVKQASLTIYEKFNQRSDPEDFGWNFAGVDYVYTDSQGRFQVTADKPPGEYAIGARLKGYVDRGFVRFSSGAGSLVLIVDRERYLSGTVLLPEGADPAQCLMVGKVPEATREERAYSTSSGTVATNGSFTISGLRKAAVSLTLQYGEEKTELVSLLDVVPTESVDVIPSRLDPWDLRKELRHIAFDVRRSDGSPAPSGFAAYGAQALALVNGRVESLVRTEEDDNVLVVAAGHLPTLLTARALPGEVQLVRGIPVRIAIDSALPLRPEGAEISLFLERSNRDWLPWTADVWKHRSHRWLRRTLWREEIIVQPGETEWTFHVPAVGSYRPTWAVRHAADDRSWRGPYTKTFSTVTGRYDIEVAGEGGDGPRWLVQLNLDHAKSAFERGD